MKFEVYIVDDDMVSQFATRYTLEQAAPLCNYVAFDSVEAVLVKFQSLLDNHEKFPEVLLLDLIMPGMNGWEFLDQFANLRAETDKPLIYILSAFQNSRDRARARENMLIHGFFDKPLSKADAQKIHVAMECYKVP